MNKYRSTPLESAEDIAWAIEVHATTAPAGEVFRFAVLYGNEDAPSQIEFWHAANPHYQAKPDFSWEAPL